MDKRGIFQQFYDNFPVIEAVYATLCTDRQIKGLVDVFNALFKLLKTTVHDVLPREANEHIYTAFEYVVKDLPNFDDGAAAQMDEVEKENIVKSKLVDEFKSVYDARNKTTCLVTIAYTCKITLKFKNRYKSMLEMIDTTFEDMIDLVKYAIAMRSLSLSTLLPNKKLKKTYFSKENIFLEPFTSTQYILKIYQAAKGEGYKVSTIFNRLREICEQLDYNADEVEEIFQLIREYEEDGVNISALRHITDFNAHEEKIGEEEKENENKAEIYNDDDDDANIHVREIDTSDFYTHMSKIDNLKSEITEIDDLIETIEKLIETIEKQEQGPKQNSLIRTLIKKQGRHRLFNKNELLNAENLNAEKHELERKNKKLQKVLKNTISKLNEYWQDQTNVDTKLYNKYRRLTVKNRKERKKELATVLASVDEAKMKLENPSKYTENELKEAQSIVDAPDRIRERIKTGTKDFRKKRDLIDIKNKRYDDLKDIFYHISKSVAKKEKEITEKQKKKKIDECNEMYYVKKAEILGYDLRKGDKFVLYNKCIGPTTNEALDYFSMAFILVLFFPNTIARERLQLHGLLDSIHRYPTFSEELAIRYKKVFNWKNLIKILMFLFSSEGHDKFVEQKRQIYDNLVANGKDQTEASRIIQQQTFKGLLEFLKVKEIEAFYTQFINDFPIELVNMKLNYMIQNYDPKYLAPIISLAKNIQYITNPLFTPIDLYGTINCTTPKMINKVINGVKIFLYPNPEDTKDHLENVNKILTSHLFLMHIDDDEEQMKELALARNPNIGIEELEKNPSLYRFNYTYDDHKHNSAWCRQLLNGNDGYKPMLDYIMTTCKTFLLTYQWDEYDPTDDEEDKAKKDAELEIIAIQDAGLDPYPDADQDILPKSAV